MTGPDLLAVSVKQRLRHGGAHTAPYRPDLTKGPGPLTPELTHNLRGLVPYSSTGAPTPIRVFRGVLGGCRCSDLTTLPLLKVNLLVHNT